MLSSSSSSSHHRRRKQKTSVRILICSSNLGNAQPDYDSLNAWIPVDGYCEHVVPSENEEPQYPVVFKPPKQQLPSKSLVSPEAAATTTQKKKKIPSSSSSQTTSNTEDVVVAKKEGKSSDETTKEESAANTRATDTAADTEQVSEGGDVTTTTKTPDDDYEAFLAAQNSDGGDTAADDEYEAFLAAQNANFGSLGGGDDEDAKYDDPYAPNAGKVSYDDGDGATAGNDGDDYEAFLAAQNAAFTGPADGGRGDDGPQFDDPYAPSAYADAYANAAGDDDEEEDDDDDDDEDDYADYNEDDDYEKFLASQAAAASDDANVVLGDDPYAPPPAEEDYDAFLARQQQDDAAPQDDDEDEYAKFLEGQKKKTLSGFMEVEEEKRASMISSKANLLQDSEHVSSEVGGAQVSVDESVQTDGFQPTDVSLLESTAKAPETATTTPTATMDFANFANFSAFDDKNNNEQAGGKDDNNAKERFDIIIIGMQEATFEAKEEGEEAAGEEEEEEEDEDSLHRTDSVGSIDDLDPTHEAGEPASPPKKASSASAAGDASVASTATTATTSTTDVADEPKTSNKSPKGKKSLTGKLFGAAGKAVTSVGGEKLLNLSAAKSATKGATKLLNATAQLGKKAGKATMTAASLTTKATKTTIKVTEKATKGASKAAKAAKILTTSADHTKSCTPTLQQANNLDGNPMGDWSDTDILHCLIEDQLPSYKRAVSFQQGEMRLIMYYRDTSIDLDVLSVKAQNTGKGGLANKGGIVAEIAVNQTTKLAFGTAHLEAHEGHGKYMKRCSSVTDILRGTASSLTTCRCDASVANHFMFFMGDLNFRTRLNGYEPGSAEHVEATHELVGSTSVIEDKKLKAEQEREKEAKKAAEAGKEVKKEDAAETKLAMDDDEPPPKIPDDPPASCYYTLNVSDELAYALRIKQCFVGFKTPYCNFPPTFKVGRQMGYKYNPKRSPSYTDRILFRTSDQLESALTPLVYEPVVKFTSSDHKPIRGAYEIQLNPKIQMKPSHELLQLR